MNVLFLYRFDLMENKAQLLCIRNNKHEVGKKKIEIKMRMRENKLKAIR